MRHVASLNAYLDRNGNPVATVETGARTRSRPIAITDEVFRTLLALQSVATKADRP